MKYTAAVSLTLGLCVFPRTGAAQPANAPQAEISNGVIKAKLYLPDAKNGFYRSTRFDWSGAIYSLEFRGHDFYGPWFTKYDPSVRDFVYKGADIIVGAASGIMGPVDEFQKPVGYDTAKTGGTFIKVGVGVLRKPEEKSYASFRPYEVVDPGKWTIHKANDHIEFTQELTDPETGYGYVYRKVITLASGKGEMIIDHTLRNTGRLPIRTNVYNHNFLVLDKAGPAPDLVITLPFTIQTKRPPDSAMAEIKGQEILYKTKLANEDRLFFPIEGFGSDAKDYDIRIESRKTGAGMRITGDRPLSSAQLWSIRSVMALEPFINVSADPGGEFTWRYTYTYYTLPR